MESFVCGDRRKGIECPGKIGPVLGCAMTQLLIYRSPLVIVKSIQFVAPDRFTGWITWGILERRH